MDYHVVLTLWVFASLVYVFLPEPAAITAKDTS